MMSGTSYAGKITAREEAHRPVLQGKFHYAYQAFLMVYIHSTCKISAARYAHYAYQLLQLVGP